MDNYYPPVAFYFRLSISGMPDPHDASFQEVSGISMEMGVEEITEGGENRFKHKLPSPPKFADLVLKRGMIRRTSQLANWCTNTLQSDFSAPLTPHTLSLALVDKDGHTLMSWEFINAHPVKWSISDFKSQEDQLAIESIEFAYSYFTRTK